MKQIALIKLEKPGDLNDFLMKYQDIYKQLSWTSHSRDQVKDLLNGIKHHRWYKEFLELKREIAQDPSDPDQCIRALKLFIKIGWAD